MNLDHPLHRAACRTVVAVDILGQQPALWLSALQLGNHMVSGIRLSAQASLAQLRQIFPAQRRITLQHRARQRFLNRQAFGGVTVIQAAEATIGGQTGIGGQPGTGNQQDTLSLFELLCDLLDCPFHRQTLSG